MAKMPLGAMQAPKEGKQCNMAPDSLQSRATSKGRQLCNLEAKRS
jgi:hypothetical protein